MQIVRDLFTDGKTITMFGSTGFAESGTWFIDRGNGLFEVNPFPAGLYMEMLIMKDFQGSKFSDFSCFRISPIVGIALFLEGRISKEDVEKAYFNGKNIIFRGINFNTSVGKRPLRIAVTNTEVEFIITAIAKDGAASCKIAA